MQPATGTTIDSTIRDVAKSNRHRKHHKEKRKDYRMSKNCFLVAWLDHCIAKKLDFLGSVEQAFLSEFHRQIGRTAALKAVVKSVTRWARSSQPEDQVLSKGSHCETWDGGFPNVQEELSSYRNKLGLPQLTPRTAPARVEVLDDTVANQNKTTKTKRNHKTISRTNQRRSERAFLAEAYRAQSEDVRQTNVFAPAHHSESSTAIPESTFQRHGTPAPSESSHDDSKSKNLAELDWELIQRLTELGEEPNQVGRWRSILRQTSDPPDEGTFSSIVSALMSQEKKAEDLQNQLQAVLGTRKFLQATEVILAPSEKWIETEWSTIWKDTREIFGEFGVHIPPPPDLLQRFMDKAQVSTKRSEFNEMADWYRKRMIKDRGFAMLMPTFAAYLLCQLVFASPDAMLQDQYSDLLLHHYETIRVHDKLSEVKRLDSLAIQNSMQTEKQRQKRLAEARDTAHVLIKIITKARVIQGRKIREEDVVQLCGRAIELKMALIVSPMYYRIVFFQPQTTFNATSMIAETLTGSSLYEAETIEKKLIVNLFPGIAQCFPSTPGPGARIVDQINKRFLCTPPEESPEMQNLSPIVKATVLLDPRMDMK